MAVGQSNSSWKKTTNYDMFESLFYSVGTMKSFSATVSKGLMINRLFKIVLTKCSFDFANIQKPQSYYIGVKCSSVKLASKLCKADERN